MPLIIICGPPSSGKTTKAKEIIKYINEKKPQIQIELINEEKFEINKEEIYSDNKKEKSLKGFFRSNVNKNLGQQNLVILDSMNYVKGFRYELFCIARTSKTPHCVVYVNADIYTVQEFNEKTNTYSKELLQDLWNRMEKPQEKNRWDKPLFSILPEDELPFEEIYQHLFENKQTMKKNPTTQSKLKYGDNYTQTIDKIVNDIVIELYKKIQDNKSFQNNKIFICKIKDTELKIKRETTLNDLKKWKNEFLNMNKLNPFKNNKQAQEGFLYYLKNKQFFSNYINKQQKIQYILQNQLNILIQIFHKKFSYDFFNIQFQFYLLKFFQ